MTRKHTKFQTCERHRWLEREPRRRRAEFFCEGGPSGQSGCCGGICRMWPGTDLFVSTICDREFPLPWTATADATAGA